MRTPLMAANRKMHRGPEEAVGFFNRFVEAIGEVVDREVLDLPALG